ncbi:2831_t:CDS:2, partial [Racocetra persica]
LNKKKEASAISQSLNTSNQEEATQFNSKLETYKNEQSLENEDKPFSKTNKMSVLIKRLKTLEKLQTAYNKNISSLGTESSDKDFIVYI